MVSTRKERAKAGRVQIVASGKGLRLPWRLREDDEGNGRRERLIGNRQRLEDCSSEIVSCWSSSAGVGQRLAGVATWAGSRMVGDLGLGDWRCCGKEDFVIFFLFGTPLTKANSEQTPIITR